jgi:hypothetical protein
MFALLRHAQVARLCSSTGNSARSTGTRSIFASIFATPLPLRNALPSSAFANQHSQPRPLGFAVGVDERRRIEALLDNYSNSTNIQSTGNKRLSEALLEQRAVFEALKLLSDGVNSVELIPYAAASPARARQGLVDFLTLPYPMGICNVGSEHSHYSEPGVPTVNQLQQSAEALFHWLTTTFASACQQVRIAGRCTPPPIYFRAPKYDDLIAPELAALLDVQIAHYAILGVVPVVEYRALEASLRIARMLPPRLVVNWWTCDHGEVAESLRYAMPLTLAMRRARSAAETRRERNENQSDSLPSLAPLRVELFFEVAADECMQWAGLEEECVLSRREVSGLNIEYPGAHNLGLFCRRTYSIAVVADATLPLRFKLRNLNEAVWAE